MSGAEVIEVESDNENLSSRIAPSVSRRLCI